MTSAESGARSGISYILGATVVAGLLGYVIQAIVPAFTSAADYLDFSVFWSAVYLVVAAISGVQQEVTRATRRGEGTSGGRRTLLQFAGAAALLFTVLVLASAFLWMPATFGAAAASLVGPLATAAGAYTLVAVLSGVFYGARRWRSVAGLTVADSGIRLIAIVAVLALGGGIVLLGWAVALPFLAAVAVLWWVSGRRALHEVELDVPLRGLAVHSASTVGAALATGVMISGLPLLLGVTARSLGEATLAALILVITLTRAPLVIPILALQSFLVVTFRDAPERAPRRTLTWGALLLVATAVLAAAGAVIGPWLIDLLYQGRYTLEPLVYAAVIAGAGTTALVCLTGAAALAAGDHARYVAGWAASSVALLLVLVFAPTGLWTVVTAIALAPAAGVVIHLTAFRRAAPSA